jgi:hypothetical protein
MMTYKKIIPPGQIDPADPPTVAIAPTASEFADAQATILMLKAKVAFLLEGNQAANYQLLKNAVTDTGIPRETLRRWCEVNPPKVACYRDEWGELWVDVTDGRRVRFELARVGG